MALSKLSDDVQGLIFVQLCNVLDPGVAVALGRQVRNDRGLFPKARPVR